MASEILIPTVTLPAGTRAFGPAALVQNVSSVEMVLDRSTWTDSALTITLSLDLSLDGGVTWASTSPGIATNPFPVACEAVGGTLLDKNGQVSTQTILRVANIPQPGSATRQIRGTLSNSRAFTTSGTLVTG